MITESERAEALKVATRLLTKFRLSVWESGWAAGVRAAITGTSLFETASRLSAKYGLDESETHEQDKNQTSTVRQ